MILYRVEITNNNTDPTENSWSALWFSKLEEAHRYFKNIPKYWGAYLDKVDLRNITRETLVEVMNLAHANRMNLPTEEIERQVAEVGR